MARPINSLVLWSGRYLFMVLFGNQFRRAPLAIHGLLAMFIFYQVKELAEKQHIQWDEHSWPELFDVLGLLPWAQTIFMATLSIALLNYQVIQVRYLYRTCCVIVLLLLSSVTGFRFWSQTLPFTRTVPFWIVFTISASYHYRSIRIPSDIRSWQDAIPKFLRSIRIAVRNEVGPSPKEVSAAVTRVQHDKARTWKNKMVEKAEIEQVAQSIRERPRRVSSLSSTFSSTLSTKLDYKTLVGNEIRLLRVTPLIDIEPGCLDFTLEHTTLSEVKKTYTALSYCWGGNEKTKEITIDRVRVKVTPNLYDALRDLLTLGYREFWVDAVCINQEDWVERSSQVLRMFQIFQSAREVVAWLGRENIGAKRVMLQLKEMSDKMKAHDRRNSFSLDDLKRFMQQEFWRRIWIIQELAAAAQVNLVCCGMEGSLDNLRPLIGESLEWENISEKDWPIFLEERQLIENILEIRTRRTKSMPLSLLEALIKTKASESSIDHDRVYGLLGLVTDQKNFVTEPDYELTNQQLCIDMTLSWIRERRSLDIILGAPRHGQSTNLPSWCPDYLNAGTIPFNERIIKYISGHEHRHRMGEEGRNWKTTAPTAAVQNETFDLIDNTILRVTAVPVGIIDAVGPLPEKDGQAQKGTEDGPFHTPNRSDSQLIRPHSRTKSDPSIHFDSPYNAMCRLLLLYDPKFVKFAAEPVVLGMLYHFLGFYRWYAASAGSIAEEVQNWLDLNQNTKIHGKKLKDRAQASALRMSQNFTKGLFKKQTTTMMVWHYHHITKVVYEIIKEEMRLMTTQEGAVGWAHPEAKPYDKIFLIAGCSLPVILRRVPGRPSAYEVVGHAYVDGYMDGRKWEIMESRAEKVDIV